MKRLIAGLAVLSTIVLVGGSALSRSFHPAKPSVGRIAASHREIARAVGKLPLAFEPNVGQADSRVRFISRERGSTLLLAPTQAALSLRRPDAGRGSGISD